MPKEIVHLPTFDIEICWDRDALQIAVLIPEPKTSDDPTTLGQLLETDRGADILAGRGLPTDVTSRRDVQQIIRTLRRARNAVWGADE